MQAAPYKELPFPPVELDVTRRADGAIILRSPRPLTNVARSVCDYLPKWASEAPDRIFLAQRDNTGKWRGVSYASAWRMAQSFAQALLERGYRRGDHLAILSGNSIEHAIVTFGAMCAGLAVAPISPSYTLLPGGLDRLAHIGELLHPSLVFVQQLGPYRSVMGLAGFRQARWIATERTDQVMLLDELLTSRPGAGFVQAFDSLGPDDVGKILFTSGSTGLPKGVLNTHRMMASAVAMGAMVSGLGEPSVQLEWLPWHHTMGGNATLNSVLRNGGSLYIDDGRPTSDAIHRTIANLRSVSPTSMMNVPLGWALLVDALKSDGQLRQAFFRRLQRCIYGGAAMPSTTLDAMQELAVSTIGRRIPFVSGYGTTETAPGICSTQWPSEESGEIGVPFPGLEVKLIPVRDCYEIRVRGPNVMPGYLKQPEATRAAFDEEGFYCIGDTVTFVNSDTPSRGLRFSGRLSESFKLTNGTWVVGGDLRVKLLNACDGVLRDAVIAGENRDALTVLAWINPERAATLASDKQSGTDVARLSRDPGVLAYVCRAFEAHNQSASSSNRVSAFMLLDEPPSLGKGEITDKAYINQRAVLANRAALVDALYAESPESGVVICAGSAPGS
ncbi:AMP-binding protein [Bradyrhizobium genosp. P]|uniref:AMP-binding protein n=1 Tax=Bradyrhizobium genosp. P TaxID=83641 RepID=UPI003CE6E7B9